MAIPLHFQVIKNAVLENLNNTDPEKIIFFVGRKAYKAKDLIKHFTEEDQFAAEMIDAAIKVNSDDKILGNPFISEETVKATVKMFTG